MTLIQGWGVRTPSLSTMTYSRPLSSNPPRPLANARSFGTAMSFRGLFQRPAWNGGSRAAGAGALRAEHLFGERSAPAEKHGSRNALQDRAQLRGDQVGAQQKNVAERVSRFGRKAHLAGAHQAFERALQILLVGVRLFVDDHEIHRRAASSASIHARAEVGG